MPIRRIFMVVWLLMLTISPGWGHPAPSSAVLLRLHPGGIEARLYLPLSELEFAREKPLPLETAESVQRSSAELNPYLLSHVRPVAPDGRLWTVRVDKITPGVEATPDVQVDMTLTPPSGASADRLTLNYDVIFHRVLSHTAVVFLTRDWRNGLLNGKPLLLGTLRDQNSSLAIDRSQGSWFRGFAAVFRLGAQHIAEGTDHLLFLLALLLPAPLLIAGDKWGGYAGGKASIKRIIKVVTSFTIGHSITLLFGALGWVHLPGPLIESAIALSIFISAIHALTPIFQGKEVYIAGGFGLVHGLAFASTLADFGLDPLTMVSSIFAFNLGIEAFQLFVIIVTMCWLVMLARTRVYTPLRIIGASLTGIAASSWFFERAFGWYNPVGPIVERVASQAVWLVIGLAALAILASLIPQTRTEAVPS